MNVFLDFVLLVVRPMQSASLTLVEKIFLSGFGSCENLSSKS